MLRVSLLNLLLLGTLAAADYTFCLLGNGPKSGTFEKKAAEEMQKAHMEHINKMWKAGVLESAGPVAKLPGVRGIFVFSVAPAEAQKWAAQDPKVAAGDLSLDCSVWQAPLGVGRDYRERYGKPGFQDIFKGYTAVFSKEKVPAESLVAGPIAHPKWKYFQVLSGEWSPSAEQQSFTWYHDAQVWPKARPE